MNPQVTTLRKPLLLEINTRCWLQELSSTSGRPITLANVQDTTFAEWVKMGVTHIWLMGVWTTGPRSRQRALDNAGLRQEYDLALPGWGEANVLGSPYALAAYEVPATLGGTQGLQSFRKTLHHHGMGLVLDYVPNHVGLDHPWIDAHPERCVQCEPECPFGFARQTRQGRKWIAHGRDPHFAPWDDTAQLDYRRADVREAMAGELLRLADLCDGVRCDMAMLLLEDVFTKTWEESPLAGDGVLRASGEFWLSAIARVKERSPGFMLLAEAYWGMEEELCRQGFDFAYDKQITDALLRRRPRELTRYINGHRTQFISQGAHFLENHDEVRVASVLSLEEHRAAALAMLALPGMRILHEGQLQGARVRTPVQLGSRARESVDTEVEELYSQLLRALRNSGVGNGEAHMLRTGPAWHDNLTWQNFLALQWGRLDAAFTLVIVNLADHRSQCRVALHTSTRACSSWHFKDLLGAEEWIRASAELRQSGLFLDVPPHATQIFLCTPG